MQFSQCGCAWILLLYQRPISPQRTFRSNRQMWWRSGYMLLPRNFSVQTDASLTFPMRKCEEAHFWTSKKKAFLPPLTVLFVCLCLSVQLCINQFLPQPHPLCSLCSPPQEQASLLGHLRLFFQITVHANHSTHSRFGFFGGLLHLCLHIYQKSIYKLWRGWKI